MMYERDRRLLEAQVKDIVARCDDAETNALKGGKKAMAKMETRIRELESEMDAEQRRYGDAQKNMRKSERHVKELIYQQEEDRKNQKNNEDFGKQRRFGQRGFVAVEEVLNSDLQDQSE